MKFSAAIAAAVLFSAPAFAEEWAPAINASISAAVETAAVPAPVRTGPRDGANYSGAEELLIKEFGITAIGLDIPEAEVMRQGTYYTNAFCFEHALRTALTDLLENPGNAAGPLAKALDELGITSKPSKSELKKARQKVLDLLNAPASHLSIVRPYKLNQPLNGETVEKNWVFFLRLDGVSYWSIVDRAGEKPAYTYGAAN
jgi:hypothetical protein